MNVFPLAAIPIRNGTFFGTSEVPLLLDNVVCQGGEANLLQCSHNGIRQHNCDRLDTAGVICGGNNCF